MSTALFGRLRQYLAARHPGATISDFQYVKSGWESDVYAFTLHFATGDRQNLILRLYPSDDAVEKSTREVDGLRQLHQAGYPVPEAFFHETDTTILGHPFTIMEKLDGQTLWPVLSHATASQESRLLDQFCRLLARLHRLDWRPFTDQATRYEADPAAVLDDLLALWRQWFITFGVKGFLAVVDWLENHKTGIAAQPAVVHLDFHANNVFLLGEVDMAVIDWTQVAVSDYRCDLAWTLLIMGDYGRPHWRDAILAAYTRAAGHPVDQLDYFDVIASTKLIASTVISLRVGPEKQGMRPETVAAMNQQSFHIRWLYQRLQAITGLAVPEVQTILGEFG